MSTNQEEAGSNIASVSASKERRMFASNKARYGDKIRERRLACGYNTPQLAAILGVAKNTITNWEAGRSRPDLNQLVQLCNALNTTVAWFLGVPDRTADINTEERKHLENYRLLSSPNRRAIDDLINSMIEIADKEMYERCLHGFERIRRSGNMAAAGPQGSFLDDDRDCDYAYVRTNRNACLADEIVTVSGDSMEPTFHDGDDLLIEFSEELDYGEIGIFVADGVGYVKEYQEDGLHSHNPKYSVLRFTDDDNVRCIGRVLGTIAPEEYASKLELVVLEDIRQEKQRKKR